MKNTFVIVMSLAPSYEFALKLAHRMKWPRVERFLEKHPKFVSDRYYYAVRMRQRTSGEWDVSMVSTPMNQPVDPRWPDPPDVQPES